MSDNYILTINGYIENYQIGESNNLSDNTKLYKANSITGSKKINSKYDSTTDSFISPTTCCVEELNLLQYYDVDQGEIIEYFTDSLPVTLSFSSDITTNPIPNDIVESSFNAHDWSPESYDIPISDLEISNNNKLQFKLNPTLSQDINWEVFPEISQPLEVKVNVGKLEFDSLNDKLVTTSCKINLQYSRSALIE